MSTSTNGSHGPDPARPGGFHRLRIGRVVRETAAATTFALDIPAPLRPAFTYRAGQYCTFRVRVDGRPHERCYSMSSAPEVDAHLAVTVKRVPGGVVSNWMNDTLAPGDHVDVSRPLGRFHLRPSRADLVAFTAGSGITPVFSLVKSALATTDRRIRLVCANRNARSVIFASALEALADRHPGRLRIEHHLDEVSGLITPETIRHHLGDHPDAEAYLCGPAPFMDLVRGTLLAAGLDGGRILTEHFDAAPPGTGPPTSGGPVAPDPAPAGTPGRGPADGREVTIELDGQTRTTGHRAGTTILQTARQAGLAAPFSCEAGNCATCMARVVEGRATMHANHALTDDEVADGWVLTCQAEPATPSVHVVYGFEET